MSSNISRRDFLTKSTAGMVIGSAVLSTASRRVLGANDTVNIACIGIRSRGRGLMENFAKINGVKIKYLVDVDENLLPERVAMVEEIAGYRPKTEWDMRKVFEDKDVDAVVIAVPNHWHALATIWAAQAGKNVYVEKPSCHNMFEGRKMVEAARRYGVLVQVGFQNRSRINTNAAMKFLHDGKLGKIYMARGLCFKPRNDIGRYPDGYMKASDGPFSFTVGGRGSVGPYTKEYMEKVHYDMWLGPAPKRPFNRNRFHYNWHWHWDYGNGDTGNQGPHQFDIARWGLNKEEYPIKISSKGGMFIYDCSQETPNTQTSLFEYGDGTILEFGTRGLMTDPEGLAIPTAGVKPIWIGNLFFGSEGWMQIDSGGNWQTFFGRKNEPGPSSKNMGEEEYDPMNLAGTGGGGHQANFIKAVRSGKQSDLTCDIEIGFRSSALPILANISYRLGRELMFNGKKEKFVDDKEADAMLTRDYRDPYVVPEKV